MTDLLSVTVYENITVGDLVEALLIIIGAVIIAKIATINLRRLLKERMAKEHVELLCKALKYLILFVAFVAVLQMFGISMSGLLVASGFLGMAIGFASKSAIGNLISGLFLMVERPIKIGDAIEIGSISGVVKDIHILSTIIRTWDGLYVRIPNERVFTSNITNYVAHPVRRFEYVIGIRYQDDAEKAVKIVENLLSSHPFVLKNPAPQIFVNELADSSVNLVVKAWAPTQVWYATKTELLWKIKKVLEENGIEIPFPQRVVWFANELETKVKGGRKR